MKIEFLPDGSPDCPIIRMFEFQPNEVEALRTACRELAEGKRTEFVLHEQARIEAVGGCAFIWKAGTKDVGVRLPRPGDPFVFIFSDEGWREVDDKLLPFAQSSPGFNWLTDGGMSRFWFRKMGAGEISSAADLRPILHGLNGL